MATIVKVPVLTLPLKNTLVNMDTNKSVSMGDKDKLIKEIFVDKLNYGEMIPVESQARTINRLRDYKLLAGHVWQDHITGRFWQANGDIAKDADTIVGTTGATVKPFQLPEFEGINQAGSARGKLTDNSAYGTRYMKAIAGTVTPASARDGRVWTQLTNEGTPYPWAPCSTTVEGKGGWVAGAPPGCTGMVFTGGVGKEGTGWEAIGMTALAPHTTARPYKAGELCMFNKNIYRANSDINQGTAFAQNLWTFFAGTSPGSISAFGPTSDTSGWWLCNGSTINSPGSLLHGTAAPNLIDRVIAGAGSEGGTGSVAGETSRNIALAELPNHEAVVTQENESTTHTHGVGTYTVPMGGGHYHTYTYTSGSSRTLSGGGSYGFQEVGSQYNYNVSGDGQHTHTISGSSATQSSNHTHVSRVRINGNQTQSKLDLRQKTIYMNYYIKL